MLILGGLKIKWGKRGKYGKLFRKKKTERPLGSNKEGLIKTKLPKSKDHVSSPGQTEPNKHMDITKLDHRIMGRESAHFI